MVVAIIIGLFLLALGIDNGLSNIAHTLLIRALINKGMTPEEVKEYVRRLLVK